MTPADWHRRFFEAPQREHQHQPNRAEAIEDVLYRVKDYHALGTMVYESIIGRNEGNWFDGSFASIQRAIRAEQCPRPIRPLPKSSVEQALLIYSGHTKTRFQAWAETARTISFGSYLSWLKRECQVEPFRSNKRDPLTQEAMTGRKIGVPTFTTEVRRKRAS